MDKHGVVMPFYFVLLTVVMCGLVLLGYAYHQKVLEGSLVSPLPVVEAVDGMRVFEIKEVSLIKSVVGNIDFDSGGFEYMFLVNFLDGMDSEMKDFVLNGLVVNDAPISKDSEESFFRNYLYSVKNDEEGLFFARRTIEKRMELRADNKSKVNFPVDVDLEVEGVVYLIGRDGSVSRVLS